jgi:hypothetical protein
MVSWLADRFDGCTDAEVSRCLGCQRTSRAIQTKEGKPNLLCPVTLNGLSLFIGTMIANAQSSSSLVCYCHAFQNISQDLS